MNSQTYAADIAEVRPAATCSTTPPGRSTPTSSATTSHFLGVPLATLCLENFEEPARADPDEEHRLRRGRRGAASASTSRSSPRCSPRPSRATRRCATPTSWRCAWATTTRARTSTARSPSRSRRWTRTGDSILIDGNTATALGCLYAGATVAAWYPITPATAVMDNFTALCARVPAREGRKRRPRRRQRRTRNNYLIIQAEDEIASIGMVLGAAWSGARAFTSTSGPGISLMSELLGLAYYTEIPAVIIDVQRVGPSTGMPTRTQQGDILMCAYASHGDTKHIVLFPANPARVLRVRRQGLRPRRAVPDAGLPALGPRHRDERLGRARSSPGTTTTCPTAAGF